MKRTSLVLVLALCATGVNAQIAQAALVGDDLSVAPTADGGDSPLPGILVGMLPGNPTGDLYTFPSDGTATAFRVRVGSPSAPGSPPSVQFKILRPTSASSATVVDASPTYAAPFNATSEFGGQAIAVQAGDLLGLHVVNRTPILRADPSGTLVAAAGAFSVGDTATMSMATAKPGVRATYNAEYTPDEPGSSSTSQRSDTTPPSASFSGLLNRATLRRVRDFDGMTSIDAKRVEFALQRVVRFLKARKRSSARSARSRKRKRLRLACANLTSANNTFAKPRSCATSKLVFLPAAIPVLGQWSFSLSHKLRAGTYRAFVRAIDAAGNTDSVFSAAKRNTIAFRVRLSHPRRSRR